MSSMSMHAVCARDLSRLFLMEWLPIGVQTRRWMAKFAFNDVCVVCEDTSITRHALAQSSTVLRQLPLVPAYLRGLPVPVAEVVDMEGYSGVGWLYVESSVRAGWSCLSSWGRTCVCFWLGA
jgi:hypothetical protein